MYVSMISGNHFTSQVLRTTGMHVVVCSAIQTSKGVFRLASSACMLIVFHLST